MSPKKTFYYRDLLNDDFAGTHIKPAPLGKHFKFYHKSLIYRFFASIIYYVIAIPVLWVYAKLVYGFKVVGKKKLRKAHLGRQGYFLYGNHTSIGDAMFAPTSIAAPRKSFMVCSDEAVSIKGLRWLEMLIGALPLPDSPENSKGFLEAIDYHYSHGHAVIIFPEAHIWRYCTRIRPFGEQSFTYPAQLGAPVIAMCTTYEERKFLRFLPPRAVVHLSDVIYPDMSKALGERTKALREAAYLYMVDVSSSLENVEYYRYLKKKD